MSGDGGQGGNREAEESFHYFAYGSNMFTRRLRARVPSARPVGTGYVPEHQLRWHKRSHKDGSAKCDLHWTGDKRHRVYGVLFTMSRADKANLDRAEGLGNGYGEKTVVVITPSGPCPAGTYYATAIDPQRRPFGWYKRLVLEGAMEHRLPESYIAFLKSAESVHDPDPARIQRETNPPDDC